MGWLSLYGSAALEQERARTAGGAAGVPAATATINCKFAPQRDRISLSVGS
jgi:hypothetical protein